MKICILTHTFPRFKEDIAAPFMHGVATGIQEAGNEVFVLTPYSPKFKRKKTDQKYKIITYKYIYPDSLHRLGYSDTLFNDIALKPLMYFLSPFMLLFGTIALFKLVKKEKIEVVNAHWIVPNGFIAALVSALTGIKVVSSLPGSDVYLMQTNWIFRVMGQIASRYSSAITSNSPQLLEDLLKTGVKKKKFTIIIYGVDPKKFYPNNKKNDLIRKRCEINNKTFVVLGVGRLVNKKGFRYLIEAAPHILRKNPNVLFFIIGEGDQRKELEQLSKQYKVEKNVILPGWIDYKSIVDYYNFGDVFILPSIRDERGNLDDQSVSVVEAMACAKPIITSNFPGYRIVVKDGKNGFLVNEKSSNGIANAINTFINNPKLKEEMGKFSRKLVVEKFTWKSIGEQYSLLFKQISAL